MSALSHNFRMLGTLLWKSWRTRRHRKWRTITEIILPFVFILVLLLISKGLLIDPLQEEVLESRRPTLFPVLTKKELIKNLCTIGCTEPKRIAVLAYAPKTEDTERFMSAVQSKLKKNMANIDIHGFKTEEEVEALAVLLRKQKTDDKKPRPHPVMRTLLGAVIFLSGPNVSNDFSYKIRLKTSKFIAQHFPDVERPGPGKVYATYEKTGFLGLQMLLDETFLNATSIPDYVISTQAFPYPPYTPSTKGYYTAVLGTLLPACIVIGLLYMNTTSVKIITGERITGMKQYLHTLGLTEFGYWMGAFLDLFFCGLCATVIIVAAIKMKYITGGPVLQFSSSSLLIVLLLLYILATTWFTLFISHFVPSVKYARPLASVIIAGSFILPAILIKLKSHFLVTQILASMLPNAALYLGLRLVGLWESQGVGAQWSNIGKNCNQSEPMNISVLMIVLLFDAILYCVLTLSTKSQQSMRRKLLKGHSQLFYDSRTHDDIKTKCVKCCSRKNHKETVPHYVELDAHSSMGKLRVRVMESLGLSNSGGGQASSPPTEFLGEDRRSGLKMENVTKSFLSEKILKGFTCDFFENDVTCLLGDPGSGKTVLLKLLMGTLQADGGQFVVNGFDNINNLAQVRRIVGFCPQQTTLFPELTIMEHFMFFGRFKGASWSTTRSEGRNLAVMLKLKDIVTPTKYLQNSIKRLTSCANAFMGNSDVIVLDDPTNEMDSENCDIFWKLLQKNKEGKTILFTSSATATAAEAADRIALINDGRLRCFGSVQYINSVFGDGYTLRVKVDSKKAERLVRIMSQELVLCQVQNRVVTPHGENLTFIVPDIYASLLPTLYYQLYDHRKSFGLHSVEIDCISFEDLFQTIREMPQFTACHRLKENMMIESSPKLPLSGAKVTGCCLNISQLKALLKKHCQISLSSGFVLISQLIIPLALIYFGITYASQGLRTRDLRRYGKIDGNISQYRDAITLYNIQNQNLRSAYSSVVGSSATNNPHNSHLHTELLKTGKRDMEAFRHKYLVGVSESSGNITAMYSTELFNTPFMSLNLVTNSLLRLSHPTRRIHVQNHPIRSRPELEEVTKNAYSDHGLSAVLKSFCLFFAYALAIIVGLIAVKPMIGRVYKSHHLQKMTGVNPLIFWMSYLILDVLYIATFSAAAVIIVYFGQDRLVFTMEGGGETLFSIFLIGGTASISFAYVLSQMVNGVGVPLGLLSMLHLVGVLGSYVVYHAHDGVRDASSALLYWGTAPFPIIFVVHSFYNFGKIATWNSRCAMVAERYAQTVCDPSGLYVSLPEYSCCANCISPYCFKPRDHFTYTSGLEGYTLLQDLIIMAVFAILYFAFTVLIDFGLFRSLFRSLSSVSSDAFLQADQVERDPSAVQEAERIRKAIRQVLESPAAIMVDNISLSKGIVCLYNQVSFSVDGGECFCLLGLDALEKSRILATICGEILPSAGDIFIPPDSSLMCNFRKFTSEIGYCPPKNSAILPLTPRQLLTFYGTMRGVPGANLSAEVNHILGLIGLGNNADQSCRDFTPGMKRKLCVGIALIGNPKIICLDEPTQGVLETHKRRIWKAIQQAQKNGQAVILSSSDVQECQQLCGKIGLLINGRLQYVGSKEEIKSKFLDGYTITFKLTQHHSLGAVADIRAHVEAALQDAVFRNQMQTELKYLLPLKAPEGHNWGMIVATLERVRALQPDIVAYYTLKETTLEEVLDAMADLDVEATIELPESQLNFVGSCCTGECFSAADDHS